jgi:hypothetical protein
LNQIGNKLKRKKIVKMEKGKKASGVAARPSVSVRRQSIFMVTKSGVGFYGNKNEKVLIETKTSNISCFFLHCAEGTG